MSVREANELRYLMRNEFIPYDAEAVGALLKRIDKILNKAGVPEIKLRGALGPKSDGESFVYEAEVR